MNAAWLQLLAQGDEEQQEDALEEVARHALAGFEQYAEVVGCPELIAAVLLPLAAGGDAAAAALGTISALAAANSGQQALIAAGACDAVCQVLPLLVGGDRSSPAEDALPPDSPACKRQCLREESPALVLTDAEAGAPDDDAALLLAIRILSGLLLESPARPDAGRLRADAAAAAFASMQQVLVAPGSYGLEDKSQLLDAAAVLARLAMEPPVVEQLLQLRRPSSALTELLGSEAAVTSFFGCCFEVAPCHWHCKSLAGAPVVEAGPAEAGPLVTPAASHARQHQHQRDSLTATDAGSPVLPRLRTRLGVTAVFGSLLPAAVHCPVMAASESDPVQFLQEARRQLLQPLQADTDVRLIRAAPGPATATQGAAVAQPEQVLQAVTADGCRDAFAQGFTLVVRDMPKRCPEVAAFVSQLEQQLGLPAGANLYLTPPGAQGLKIHYDDHDVFVLQLGQARAGSKAWLLGPPQHGLLPLTHQPRLPVQLPAPDAGGSCDCGCGCAASSAAGLLPQPPAAPDGGVQRHCLRPCECLYIPRGWVHQAQAQQASAVQVQSGGQGASADAGSLHVSVGLEVESCFSAQGFLHFLIHWCSSQDQSLSAGAAASVGDDGNGPWASSLSTSGCNTAPQQQERAAAAGHGMQSAEAAAAVSAEALAAAAAALLLHMQLLQLAETSPVLRKACPVLVRDRQARAAVAQVLLQQQQQQAAEALAAAGAPDTKGAASAEAAGPIERLMEQQQPFQMCCQRHQAAHTEQPSDRQDAAAAAGQAAQQQLLASASSAWVTQALLQSGCASGCPNGQQEEGSSCCNGCPQHVPSAGPRATEEMLQQVLHSSRGAAPPAAVPPAAAASPHEQLMFWVAGAAEGCADRDDSCWRCLALRLTVLAVASLWAAADASARQQCQQQCEAVARLPTCSSGSGHCSAGQTPSQAAEAVWCALRGLPGALLALRSRLCCPACRHEAAAAYSSRAARVLQVRQAARSAFLALQLAGVTSGQL